ncbi:N-acetylglucosaminyl deacetylase, LmbE family [Saccharopolyspora antimicrobica]|uniref:LmbE family N-acetylglucosaminyl deacetylase n=1 Tax=Saccharopolyspora antimicrobica TaxID=455193 RepID=A0A1I5H470_9PSEU|nr:PIG-L family deacetylase [Saccharopolyspora antimicrobica]RKT90126.1 LmbE family N-acetylglucosaminyl deacetylase [Saccharopolyspora antimicrobica]SFO42930.1 N-acetylglucosaminyl deacetylase, LmbE family [Saccharopolyspora antimicrobica]
MRTVALIIATLLVVLAAPVAAGTQRSHLQVVAHPDDDILFMNPDLAMSVRSGAEVTTVFLTAGESDVLPAAQYAAKRQAGARAAFAAMAGAADDWRRGALRVGGREVEVQELRARPGVRLVFLNLPDDNDPRATGGKHALTRLWRDPVARVTTLRPDGSAVAVAEHDRMSLIGLLTGLHRHFAPVIVRTHDPEPDHRNQPQWGAHHNHPDHVMTARFAEIAVRRAAIPAHLVHYRDYDIADAPPNLPLEVVADKRATFERYARHDPVVSLGDPYGTWLRSMRQRWPRGANWAATDSAGRELHVFVRGDRLFAGSGVEEFVVPTTGFVPRSAVLADARTIVAQDRYTGGIFVRANGKPWTALGAPRVAEQLTHVGRPGAAVVPGGRIVVAAKNSAGGVSIRFADAPRWTELGGTDVQDEVSVLVTGTGEVHVLAAARAGLLHWKLIASGRAELVSPPSAHRPAGSRSSVLSGRSCPGRPSAIRRSPRTAGSSSCWATTAGCA